jgi:hypothetical protein
VPLPLELFDRNSGAKFLMSAPKPKQREVRSRWSKAELTACKSDFRFTPENGLKSDISQCPKRAQKATSRSLFEDDGETVLRAVVKNLVILLPNEERSACDPFGGLRETHLRWVLGIFDRDRHAEMAIFPFTVLASDMENAPSVNPVGALH